MSRGERGGAQERPDKNGQQTRFGVRNRRGKIKYRKGKIRTRQNEECENASGGRKCARKEYRKSCTNIVNTLNHCENRLKSKNVSYVQEVNINILLSERSKAKQ